MHILLISCSPYVPTGYGVAAKNTIKAIIDAGHDVSVYSIFGNEGVIGTYNYKNKQIPLIPRDINKKDILAGLVCVKKLIKYDVIWSIYDIFAFNANQLKTDYWIAQLMIDSKPFMQKNIEALKNINTVLCVTKDAEDTLKEADQYYDYQHHEVIPLIVDTDDFYIEEGAKQKFADYFKREIEGYIFTFNGANYNDGGLERKNIPELIKWWSIWTKEHPKDILYLHTDINGDLSAGTVIEKLCELYKTDNKNILFAHQLHYRYNMLTNDYMRMIYNASDLLIVPSHSEGFGYPYCEAALCGCIPIGNNFGSGKEVIINCGGELINCVESYYTQYSVKSKSYAHDIDEAVKKAIIKIDPIHSQYIANKAQIYSIKNNSQKIKDMLDYVENAYQEVKKDE